MYLRSPLYWVLAIASTIGYVLLLLYIDSLMPNWASALSNVALTVAFMVWNVLICFVGSWQVRHWRQKRRQYN